MNTHTHTIMYITRHAHHDARSTHMYTHSMMHVRSTYLLMVVVLKERVIW